MLQLLLVPLQAALDQPNALAALQLRAEPAASEEGQPSKPCFDLVLRLQGLARVLGPQVSACRCWLRACSALFVCIASCDACHAPPRCCAPCLAA